MTTTTPSTSSFTPKPSTSALRRITNVARLHLVNKATMIGLPWLIMSVIFVASLLIWWAISFNLDENTPDRQDVFVGGASFYIVVYMLIVAVQAINLTFPFAQGYSVTRRDFYLGSSLVFVGLSIAYALAFTILGEIERATHGWGVRGVMFDYSAIADVSLLETFYMTLVAFLFFFFLGAFVASLYVRWRAWGLIGFFGGLALLLAGSIALPTITGSWDLVGAWFVNNGITGVVSWMLVPTALSALAGFFILRRATPRN